MNNPLLKERLEPYVMGLFRQYPVEHLIFHSIDHTRAVVAHASEIGMAEGIGEDGLLIVCAAAWFHDTGHLNGGIENHEMRSIELMRQFMKDQNVDDLQFIQSVADCIIATRMPHQPKGLLQEIMCDADVYHFGTKEFRKTNKQVRRELELRNYPDLTGNWSRRSLALLEEQHFFTRYCHDLLEKGKLKNIARLQEKILEKGEIQPKEESLPAQPLFQLEEREKEAPEPEEQAAEAEEGKELKKHGKGKKHGGGEKGGKDKETTEKDLVKQTQSLIARGMQTFLRLASENHLNLSSMADGKANILISVNSIIISVILSVLVNRLEVDTYLTIPTMIFLSFSVATVVIAILATRPKLTEGRFLKEDVINRKTNLMFFGNFYKSTLQDYQWAMDRLLKDKEYIYGTLVKDIYFLGKVLGRKYKLIRLAYNVFMVGILLSVAAFSIAVLFNKPGGHVTVINASGKPL